MGYSNNKWRKLLTILMIINLCFILFAKITKVLGSFTITNSINNETFNITDTFIAKYPYYAFCTTSNGNYIWVICSNSPITTNATNPDDFAFNTYYNSNNTGMTSIAGAYSYVQTTLNGTSLPNINTNTNTITTNSYGAMRVFYTNHDIKNNSSGDIIIDDTSYIPPSFDNITEIENGYPDGVFISRGSYSEDDDLFFHLLKITDTVADGNQPTYYYESKVFKLNKNSKYYRTYPNDTDNEYSYYYIQRSALTLDTDSSYLYVLSNNGNSITNSYGILQPDIPGGIYDVVDSDTAGVITAQDSINDKIANINNNQQDIANSQQDIANNSNNINTFLTENTVSNDTNNNIDTNLDFNNQNSTLNNLNNGFFTRLTTMLYNIADYDLSEDTVLRIPIPHTQKYLEFHSIIFYNHVTGGLRIIINAFWTYVFTFYLYKFINKIYIALYTGNILDTFSTSDEVITNDML